ncbi:MAG TPA: LysR family transcriptional regulator [Ramlibacter sp.]|nr:LysR family transcriptional regulator [Ramlibacter sp.]
MTSHIPSRSIEAKRYLADLLPFVESARCGSFSGAARALLLTPSAISKSIARLERGFDVRLFVRTTRQLRLTPDGQLFMTQVEHALSTLGEAVETLGDAKDEPAGRVRISSLAAFGRHFILPLIPKLLEQFPKLELELHFDDGTPDPIAERYDLALRSAPLLAQNAVARRVALLPLVLVASPRYLETHGVPQHPQELAQHACVSIRLPSGQPARWVLTHAQDGNMFRHQPQGRLVLSEQPADALVDSALAGLGVTAIAACMVLHELRSGRLKLLLPEWRLKSGAEFFLQYPNRARLPARVRASAEFLIGGLARDERLMQGPSELACFAA